MIVVEGATPRDVEQLAEVLVACVQDGASVGFLADLSVVDACAWWVQRLADPTCVVLVARDGDSVLGTVGLLLPAYPNARHRAEVTKLLVPLTARRRGVGRLLLDAAEERALSLGRSLLLLDTETDSPAQQLYDAAGWQVVGVVDGHAAKPDGRLAPTTFMAKQL